jgi:4-hydroxy-3-methylbut-2-enyl diphosphate reductase
MKITVYKSYGYCFGVKRAIEIVEKTLPKEGKTYILGEVIHNPTVNKGLSEKGLMIVDDIKDVPDNSIFFYPSHGITEGNKKKAEEKSLNCHSLICPYVVDIADKAKKYEKEGYKILIYGNPDHTEVSSLVSQLKSPIVIREKDDIEKIGNFKKAVFLSQSTQNRKKYYTLFKEIATSCYWEQFLGLFTICKATYERQDWVLKHIFEFDLFIIVGGKNSSNTKRLYDIVIENKKKGLLMEKWGKTIFNKIKKYLNIAIISGTSTPKEDVDEIVSEIKGRVVKNGSSVNIYYA